MLVPDLDSDLFAAPGGEVAAGDLLGGGMQCFLCNESFGVDAPENGLLRKVQDNFYCLRCLGET